MAASVAVAASVVGAIAIGRAVLGGGPPQITALTSSAPGIVEVAWSTIDGAESYVVSASTDRSMADAVTGTFVHARATLSGLSGGRRYYVTVRDAEGKAVIGPRAVKVRRLAPTDLKLKVVDTSAVSATWKDSEDVSRFVVRWADNPEFERAEHTFAEEPTVVVSGLKVGAKYWFDVAPADDAVAVSTPAEVIIPDSAALAVGSFNIYGVDNDTRLPSGAQKWRVRRPAVVDQIMAADLDVVGLQEANQASSYRGRVDHGRNQYEDLEAALQAKAKGWKLVNRVPYNCVRSWTPSGCRWQNRGASFGTRIVYRSDRLELLDSGTVKYDRQNTRTHRYLAWAVFRIRETGTEVFFTTTHLQPGRSSSDVRTRRSQWNQLITEVKKRAGDLPVVLTGDFNTSRNQQPGEMFEKMRSAGFPEITGTRPGVNPPTQNRAEQLVHADLGSYHGFKRNLRAGGSCYCGSKTRTGNSIDFIFASEGLEVTRWEIVANLNSAYRLVGVMPSDHHLVTAILRIPTR